MTTNGSVTAGYVRRPRAEFAALAAAQRDLIDRGYGPYHWAAFVLNGW